MAGFMVINSKFNPFSMEELTKPVADYTAEFNAQQQAYGSLAEKAVQWEQLGGSDLDKDSYQQYLGYMKSLNEAANKLLNEGLKPGGRSDVLKLSRKYNEEILPIEQAFKRREERAKYELEQPKDTIFDRRASEIALSEFIKNPNLAYPEISGNALETSAARGATALAKQMRDNPRKWGFAPGTGGQYFETRARYGYTAEEVDAAQKAWLNKLFTGDLGGYKGPKELISILDQVGEPLTKFSNPEAIMEGASYVIRGLWQALGSDKYDNLRNMFAIPSSTRSGGTKPPSSNYVLPPSYIGRTVDSGLSTKDKGTLSKIIYPSVEGEDIKKDKEDLLSIEAQIRKMEREDPQLKEDRERDFSGLPGNALSSLFSLASTRGDKTYAKYRSLVNQRDDIQARIERGEKRVNKRVNTKTEELAAKYANLSSNPTEAARYGAIADLDNSTYTEQDIAIHLDPTVYSNLLKDTARGVKYVEKNGKARNITPEEMEDIVNNGVLTLNDSGLYFKSVDTYYPITDAGPYDKLGKTAKALSKFASTWNDSEYKDYEDITYSDYQRLGMDLYGINLKQDGIPTKLIVKNIDGQIVPVISMPLVTRTIEGDIPMASENRQALGVLLRSLASDNSVGMAASLDNQQTTSGTNKDIPSVNRGYILNDSYYGFGE